MVKTFKGMVKTKPTANAVIFHMEGPCPKHKLFAVTSKAVVFVKPCISLFRAF